MAEEQGQWFRSTGGVVWGILAFALAAAVIALDIASGWHLPVVIGALLFAALAYVSLIRPRIGVMRDELVLDHMFSTVRIPAAAVDSIAVGRTFEAKVAGHSYVSAAVSRSLRELLKARVVREARFKSGESASPLRRKQHEINYADFVVERVAATAADARERAGIAEHSAQQSELAEGVRRTWAWPEVVVVAAVAVAFVLSFFL